MSPHDELIDAIRWKICELAGGAGRGKCDDDCCCPHEAKEITQVVVDAGWRQP